MQPTTYSRSVEREIAVFEGQQSLHDHGPSFHQYTRVAVKPAVELAFGRHDVHEIYAESISSAVARSGIDSVISLGCGDGAQERKVLRAAARLGLTPFRILGLELAPAVAERANAATEREGLADQMRVIVHDLNTGLPGDGDIAAVMAHHVLHHIIALESLFGFVSQRLHPEGVFVTFDMIGRNGHMRWPEVRPVMRKLWSLIPEAQRYDHVFGKLNRYYQDWDCSIEGFEGTRAQDILPLLAEHFSIGRFAAWGGLADAFVSPRFAPNFDANRPEDCAFLDYISKLEVALLDARATTPASMAAEFRSKRGYFSPAPGDETRLRRALRFNGEVFPSIHLPPFVSPWPAQPEPTLPVLTTGVHAVVASNYDVVLACLQDGWSELEDHGVFALLDEQRLSFRTSVPASKIVLHGWNPLPSERGQIIVVEADGCTHVVAGPFGHGAEIAIALSAPTPQSVWELRIHSSAYRLPESEGGEDRRPLSWLLKSVEVR
jgi:SAM-dependent methyltransferase